MSILASYYRIEVYRKTVKDTRLREIRPIGEFSTAKAARLVADRLFTAALMGRLKNVQSICVVSIRTFRGIDKRRVIYHPGTYEVIEPPAPKSASVLLGPSWSFLDEVDYV